MRALVTGGAGFIGSHLVERLLNDGHQVTVLDNLAGGHLTNLAHVSSNPGLKIEQLDLSGDCKLTEVFAGVNWVFHLAGLADIVPSITDPMKYHRANVDGTVATLEAARKAQVSQFIYAASSSCYGVADEIPTPETAPIRPMYPYALTKNIGEQCVLHWQKIYGMPCVSLRLFNVFGPRARTSGAYGAVFGVFLAQKLAGKPFTIVGDGTQTRDFTFVTDIVEAFVCAAASELQGEVFNVGSGNTYSINYLTQLLGGPTVNLPKRPGEPESTFADIGKIQSMLGWQPRVSFEEGVAIMLDNIDYWSEAPVWGKESISEVTQEWFRYLDPSSNRDSKQGLERA